MILYEAIQVPAGTCPFTIDDCPRCEHYKEDDDGDCWRTGEPDDTIDECAVGIGRGWPNANLRGDES